MNEIIQFISNVGFPIAMCLLLWYDKHTTLSQNSAALEKLKEVIDKNTSVTESLHNIIVSRETFKE